MSVTLKSSRSHYFPPCFARSAKHELFVTNGIDVSQRWNGLTAASQTMGIDAPTTAATLGSSGSGSISGTYTAYVRFLDAEGIPSSLSPISNEITAVSVTTFGYTSVPVSTDSRVTQRQIFRNTDGQETTYYLDTTISDNVTTTASSTKTDAQLIASTTLPILNPDASLNANRFTYYPKWKAFLATLHDRLWAAGDVIYTQGNVQVSNGSATVNGIGTAFTSSMVGRLFYVVGDTASYTISAVVSATELTLSVVYAGTTNLFAMYAIKVDKDERHKVYFSAAGEPESMPSLFNFKLQEMDDGDEITGLMPLGTYLFVLMRRHIFRVSFTSSPLDDVGSHLTVSRGCVNNRSWVRVEDIVYLLDREGVHRFQGGHNGGETDHVSEPIQDYFRDNKINWRASRWFFGSHNPQEEVVRFHVALGGEYLPRHAFCYHYRHAAWWIEEYPWELGGTCLAQLQGTLRCLIGGQYNKVYLQGTGSLDGPTDIAPGDTVRAAVDSATLLSITDSDAVFPASGLVGAPLAIVAGRGKGQIRRITSATSARLNIKHPWSILPDSTSTYQIGGIQWRIKTGLFHLGNVASDANGHPDVDFARRIIVNAQPTATAASLDVRQYLNHAASPRTDLVAQDEAGVVTVEGEADAAMSLYGTTATDLASARPYDTFSGYRHVAFNGKGTDPRFSDNWLSAELRGVQGRDRVIVYELGIVGVD